MYVPPAGIRAHLAVAVAEAELAPLGVDVEVSAEDIPNAYGDGCDKCGGVHPATCLVEWEEYVTARDIVSHSLAVNRACVAASVKDAAPTLFIPGSRREGAVSVEIGLIPPGHAALAAVRALAAA